MLNNAKPRHRSVRSKTDQHTYISTKAIMTDTFHRGTHQTAVIHTRIYPQTIAVNACPYSIRQRIV